MDGVINYYSITNGWSDKIAFGNVFSKLVAHGLGQFNCTVGLCLEGVIEVEEILPSQMDGVVKSHLVMYSAK